MENYESKTNVEVLEPQTLNDLERPMKGSISIKSGKKYKNPTYSNLRYYMNQLKKLSKHYLSQEEIKKIFKTIEKYEIVILSIFYHMDSFIKDLNKIRQMFEKKSSIYSNEQINLISRLSRKTFTNKSAKEKEISRVRIVLEQIYHLEKTNSNNLILLEIFQKIPFKKSYDEFIDYLKRMVERIEGNHWMGKTGAVKTALSKYTKINYNNIRNAFRFINNVIELDFENKYYFQKSFSILKKKIWEINMLGSNHRAFQKEKINLENYYKLKYDLILKNFQYAELYENKITKIFNKFSERYLYYVVFIAKKYIRNNMSFVDIIQEGNIGLLKAVRKYNYDLGSKFISYAFFWIRQRINKAIADQSKTIRIPVYVHHEYKRIKKITKRLNKEPWKDPDLKFISAETGRSEKKIHSLFKIFEKNILSLNQEIDGRPAYTLISFLPNLKVVDPGIHLEKEILKDEIHCHLNDLPKRELKIIEMRFGLKNGNKYTLEEVARKFKVSKERVRQLEEKALNKLKEKGKERLKPYLNSNSNHRVTLTPYL